MKQIRILLIVTTAMFVILSSCSKKNETRNKNTELGSKEKNNTERANELTKKDTKKVEQNKENMHKMLKKEKDVALNIVEVEDEVLVFDSEADEAVEIEMPYPRMEVVEEAEEVIFYMAEKVNEKPIEHNTEEYSKIVENEFRDVTQDPLSTLSIDVDNASYSNIRRFLNNSQLPPKDAVRIEEMINYFDYNYPDAKGEHPFNFITEISDCPWTNENKIVHIGIQGKRLDDDIKKPSNLVFLLDVSGSMNYQNKLPLLKKSFNLLLDQLDDKDKVSIVVYAGAAGLVLPPTPASEKETIKTALNNLSAGGSTAGGAGILLAYAQAKKAFIKNGNNRIILATDGDFNVGTSSTSSLVELVEKKRKDDIYLTIIGLGMGNYKDGRMEEISNSGNGNYFYIDNIKEAEKVFVKEIWGNLYTIAKDVKIQIEFNPKNVKSYRLIGYENRILAKEDFNDDKKDAGELGAGHTVTALYEIVPAGSSFNTRKTDKLKYQETKIKESITTNELMTLKFRYKPPKSHKSIKIEHPIIDKKVKLSKTSNSFRFSASVAGFGMLLRDSKFKGELNYEMIENLAKNAKGKDKNGYRAEYISLVKTAKLLSSL